MSHLLRALLLLALVACERSSPAAPPTPPPPQEAAPSARAAWVAVRPAADAVVAEAPATVLAAPGSRAVLTAPYRARVASIRARPGQQVEAGERLVEVVMPEVVQAAGAALAASLRVEAYGRQREQLLALREQGMARLAELAEAETRLAEARADLQASHAALKVAGLSPQAAREVVARGTVWLESPIAGVVTEVSATLGQVQPEAGAALVQVAGEGPLRVEARLAQPPPEGATFLLLLPARPPLPVRPVGHAPQVDAPTGTTLWWFEPGAPAAPLQAGQAGRLRVQAPRLEGAWLVPATALRFAEGRTEVLVRTEQPEPQPQPVQVLSLSGVDALVRGPLKEGQQVAADASVFEEAGGGGHGH